MLASLLQAFKDTSAQVRSVALKAVQYCVGYFEVHDITTRLLPGLCPRLSDSDAETQLLAFNVVESVVARTKMILVEHVRPEAEAASGWSAWVTSLVPRASTGDKPQPSPPTGSSPDEVWDSKNETSWTMSDAKETWQAASEDWADHAAMASETVTPTPVIEPVVSSPLKPFTAPVANPTTSTQSKLGHGFKSRPKLVATKIDDDDIFKEFDL